jgi:hypothetical protein
MDLLSIDLEYGGGSEVGFVFITSSLDLSTFQIRWFSSIS